MRTMLSDCVSQFRIPLTAMIGYCELAEEELRAEEVPEALGDIRRAAEAARQLLLMTNDIIISARLDEGNVPETLELFDTEELSRQVADSLAPLARQQDNQVLVSVEDGAREMESDPFKVGQILTNLVSNALKFTTHGQVWIRVRREEPGTLLFEVEDTGIGIAPEHQQKIFLEFHQVAPECSRRLGGTGLGLGMTRRLCGLLGGAVSVKSTLGKGSLFTARLPATLSPGGSAH